MGSVKRDIDKARYLADLFDYSNPASVKKALRNLLKLYVRAETGCPTSQAILVDLKTALGSYRIDELMSRRVLTSRQREAITLHLIEDHSIQETAQTLGIDASAVSHRVRTGIKRMVTFLRTGNVPYQEWEPEEVAFLTEHYRTKGARYCAEALDRKVSQIYEKVKSLKSA